MGEIKKEVYVKVFKRQQQATGSLDFDGVDDRINLGTPAALSFERTSAFTFETWINIDATNTLYQIFGNQLTGGTFRGFEIIYIAGTLRIDLCNTDATNELRVSCTPGFTAGQWYHLAVTYAGNSAPAGLKVYVNGEDKTLTTERNNLTATILNASTIFMGCRGGTSFFLNGKMAEVRVWNVVRTQAQIQANMTQQVATNSSGLILYYKLNETSGSIATDSSASGINGQLQSFPTNPWLTNNYPPVGVETYIGFYTDFIVSSFTLNLVTGPGEMTLQIPKKFDDFSEGTLVAFNNRIEVWAYDKEATAGVLIYQGFIIEYSGSVGSEEDVTVKVAGYATKLKLDVSTDSSFNEKYTLNQELGAMIKTQIDRFRFSQPGTSINYTVSSIANTGKTRTVNFSSKSYLDALIAIQEVGDSNYFLYLDVDNIMYFQTIPTSATHKFMFGKDIRSITFSKSIAQMRNVLNFWNGVPTGSGGIARSFIDSNSIVSYGKQVETKRDNRYTVSASVDDYGNRFIANNKDPFNTVEFDVLDSNYGNGYNIESIKPGHTCLIQNIAANNALTSNMIITQVEYNGTYAKIVCQDVKKFVERALYDLKNRIEDLAFQDGPTTY